MRLQTLQSSNAHMRQTTPTSATVHLIPHVHFHSSLAPLSSSDPTYRSPPSLNNLSSKPHPLLVKPHPLSQTKPFSQTKPISKTTPFQLNHALSPWPPTSSKPHPLTSKSFSMLTVLTSRSNMTVMVVPRVTLRSLSRGSFSRM